MERLRPLASGIAHDLNNLLTSVFGHLGLALKPELSNTERQGYLETALSAVESARALTRELGELVAPERQPRAAYSVGRLVADSARFVLGGSRVFARLRLPDELWSGTGDAARVRRVLDNLLLNALQAMPGGGYVAVGARNVELAPDAAANLTPGRYVEIRISDDGPGIPASVVKRLFAAQVTTKQHGSGIGLATCRALLEEDGGSIRLDSTVGRGATFTLLLPATTATVQPRTTQVLGRARHGERVLVVDDEPMLRRLFQTALEQHGYRVELASDATEARRAFERLRADGGALPVLLLDLTIDGGGLELLRALRELEPSVRAIASSGLMSSREELFAAGFAAVLRKPYPLNELFATVAALCDGELKPPPERS